MTLSILHFTTSLALKIGIRHRLKDLCAVKEDMPMLFIFYIALVVTILTVFIVAIKGFQELMAPIKAAKRDAELAQKNAGK